jgi:hypothetical protein
MQSFHLDSCELDFSLPLLEQTNGTPDGKRITERKGKGSNGASGLFKEQAVIGKHQAAVCV